MELKNVLRDLVNTTSSFGFTDIVVKKEDRGEGEKVYMEANTIDKQVVMKAYVKESVPEIDAPFGLGNLPMLQGLLSLKTYNTDNTTITPAGSDGVIEKLVFLSEDSNTSFLVQAERFLAKQPNLKAVASDAVVTPSASKVAELKSFAGVFKTVSEYITPCTEDGVLTFKVGNVNKNVHKGSLNFATAEGELKMGYAYSVERIMQALSRINNSTVKMEFSSKGLININVDTGIAVYTFAIFGVSA